jgi:hypothetical protein
MGSPIDIELLATDAAGDPMIVVFHKPLAESTG